MIQITPPTTPIVSICVDCDHCAAGICVGISPWIIRGNTVVTAGEFHMVLSIQLLREHGKLCVVNRWLFVLRWYTIEDFVQKSHSTHFKNCYRGFVVLFNVLYQTIFSRVTQEFICIVIVLKKIYESAILLLRSSCGQDFYVWNDGGLPYSPSQYWSLIVLFISFYDCS